MERQEKQAIILLILVICVVSGAHMVLSMVGNEPFAAPYAPDISEGKLVLLEGEVEKVSTTQDGGHMILQVQGVQVFIPASVVGQQKIAAGDRIRVYGIVQVYRGEREIAVSRSSDISLR
jgi:DNA/RNA endonuclease YhcR with UshA esterase domain